MSMMSKFVARIFGRNPNTARKPRPAARARLGCESLESREVPTGFGTLFHAQGAFGFERMGGHSVAARRVALPQPRPTAWDIFHAGCRTGIGVASGGGTMRL